MTAPILKRTLALILMVAFISSTESVLAAPSREPTSERGLKSNAAIANEMVKGLFLQIRERLPEETNERQGFLQNVTTNLQSLLLKVRGWRECGDQATTLDRREIDQAIEKQKLTITKGVVAVVPMPQSRAQGSKLESPTKYYQCVDSYLLDLWVKVAVLNSNDDYAIDLAKLTYQLFTLKSRNVEWRGQPIGQLTAIAVQIFDDLSSGYRGPRENHQTDFSGGIADLGPGFGGP